MSAALDRLEPFLGEWAVAASIMPDDALPGGCVFEWTLGGAFLLQRIEIPHPEAPDGLCIIGANADGDGYTQHYFDSRGIARVYAMEFADGVWRLSRESADFTPLPFAQRYTGTFSDDGRTIDGAWEIRREGSDWEVDFGLTYTRV